MLSHWPPTGARAGGQIGELLVAFGPSSVVELERQIRGKSAGLRTQAIVGTAAALILLVSKYGFGDVFNSGTVTLDPSRVAAQIVSGVGFLGAGLIITRLGEPAASGSSAMTGDHVRGRGFGSD